MILQSVKHYFSKNKKEAKKTFVMPKVHNDNTFDFGENHTITIESKKEFSKRTIELNMINLVELTTKLLLVVYSDKAYDKKINDLQLSFFHRKTTPVITIKEKERIFLDEMKWHSIVFGTPGTGKSYFSKQLVVEFMVKTYLIDFMLSLLNFMSENDTKDNDLILINFEQEWNQSIDHIQNILLSLK